MWLTLGAAFGLIGIAEFLEHKYHERGVAAEEVVDGVAFADVETFLADKVSNA